jgi:hypothetical protein
VPNKNWDQVGKAGRPNNPTVDRCKQTQTDESGNYCKGKKFKQKSLNQLNNARELRFTYETKIS